MKLIMNSYPLLYCSSVRYPLWSFYTTPSAVYIGAIYILKAVYECVLMYTTFY